jgi:hypothetical protein
MVHKREKKIKLLTKRKKKKKHQFKLNIKNESSYFTNRSTSSSSY